MGLLSKTAQIFGFGKKTTQKGIELSAAKDAFSDIFGGNTSSPSFTTFNTMRAQMMSFYDWVYAAASRVAEEAACIDFELYTNNTAKKSATVGRKITTNRKYLQKYTKQRVAKTEIHTKNGRLVVVKAGQPALEEVEDHPLMDLLDRPNKFMSGVEFFEMTFLHLELTGNAFWAIVRGKDKQPVELWPLYPNFMRIVPDEKEFIKGYVYTINGEQVPFEPDDIIHHKYSNPNDMRWGQSIVQAAARAIDTDTMAADYNRKFFHNSAQPDAVLYTDEMIDEKTWTRIKDQFQDMYGGTANAHKTAILENGLKYQSMNPNQREMEFLKSREFNRDMILAMFGVPKSVLGMDASMSRANAETAEYVFAKGTIKPKMLRLSTGIQEKLAPMFDERLVVSFADPVPDDKAYKLQEHKQLANLVLTANEVREDMGYEPIDGGDLLYVQGTMVPMGMPTEAPTEPEPEKPEDDAEDEEIHDDGTGGNQEDTGAGTDTGAADGSATGGNDTGAAASKSVKKGPIPVEDGCTRCGCCKGYGEHYTTGFECYRCDASGSVTETEAKEAIPCPGREDSDEVWVDDDGNYRHAEEKGNKAPTTRNTNSNVISITITDKDAVESFFDTLKGVNYPATMDMATTGSGATAPPTPKKKVSASHELHKAVEPGEYLDKRNEVADKYEPKVIDAVIAHTKEQKKEVLANLEKRLKAIQSAKSKRVIKANLENLFDPEKSEEGWQARLSIIFEKIIAAMGIVSIKQLEEALGEEIEPYDPFDPSVKEFYTQRIRRISVYFDEETQKQLAATLREGIDAGESVDELRKRVDTLYKASQPGDLMWHRAERIGRTEPIFATTWTTLDSWKKSGHVIGKRWHTAPGAYPPENNPCGFCRSMHGKVVELDTNYFNVGDTLTINDDNGNEQSMKLNYVDTVGPPLHPNCRCTLLPILEGESLE